MAFLQSGLKIIPQRNRETENIKACGSVIVSETKRSPANTVGDCVSPNGLRNDASNDFTRCSSAALWSKIKYLPMLLLLAWVLAACGTTAPASSPSAQSYFADGYAAARNGDWAAAEVAFSAGLAQNQNHGEPFTGRGWARLNQQNFDAALADFRQAIALTPADPSAWAGLGRAQLKLGEYESARESLTQAVTLSPFRYGAFIDRGLAYYKQGNYEQAIADFTRGIRSNARTERGYYNRGLAYMKLGQYPPAIADFSHIIDRNP